METSGFRVSGVRWPFQSSSWLLQNLGSQGGGAGEGCGERAAGADTGGCGAQQLLAAPHSAAMRGTAPHHLAIVSFPHLKRMPHLDNIHLRPLRKHTHIPCSHSVPLRMHNCPTPRQRPIPAHTHTAHSNSHVSTGRVTPSITPTGSTSPHLCPLAAAATGPGTVGAPAAGSGTARSACSPHCRSPPLDKSSTGCHQTRPGGRG